MTLLALALLEVVRGTTLCLPVLQMAAYLTIDNSRSAAGNPWDKLLTLGERASSPVSWECIIDILNSHTFLNSAMLGYHTQKAMFRTPLSLGSKVTYKSWSNLQVVEARKKLQQLKMGWRRELVIAAVTLLKAMSGGILHTHRGCNWSYWETAQSIEKNLHICEGGLS